MIEPNLHPNAGPCLYRLPHQAQANHFVVHSPPRVDQLIWPLLDHFCLTDGMTPLPAASDKTRTFADHENKNWIVSLFSGIVHPHFPWFTAIQA